MLALFLKTGEGELFGDEAKKATRNPMVAMAARVPKHRQSTFWCDACMENKSKILPLDFTLS